jgi:hypothetical protein
LPPEILDREREAVARLLAEHRCGARQGHDDADLDFFLGDGVIGCEPQQKRQSGRF